MDSKEDLEYIERLKEGDINAFSYFVYKHKNMVYTVALKILGNTMDAQDVAQESFVKAFQQIHSFKGESKFSTWLYTIAYRTALYSLRRNTIHIRPINSEDHEKRDLRDNSPLERLAENERKRYVKAAINRLPKTEALLITLFYMDDNSIKEISGITGLSVINVKVKLFRARKRLMKDLGDLLKDELKTIL